MEKNDSILDGALASSEMEGVTLKPEVVDIIRQAIENDKGDTSFLLEICKLLEEMKSNENGHRQK